MLRIFLYYLSLLLPLLALMFLVRLVCALFSERIRDLIRKQRTLHVLWGCCALATVGYYWVVVTQAWPPVWMKRRAQREEVLKRIEAVGGWAALKLECDAFARAHQNDEDEFRWYRDNTNLLPQSIAALKPREVQFYPPSILRQFKSEQSILWFGTNIVVRIQVFGLHSTGGRGAPYLGIEVLCEPGLTNYCPQRLRSTRPLRYWRYREVAAGIYECY